MKQTTIRLAPEHAKQIEDYGKFLSSSIEKMTKGFLALRKYSLFELKGIFTRKEIIALADSLNGYLSNEDFQANRNLALAHLEDFELLENGISRHEADPAQLFDKIKSLSSAQIYFLQDEILRWWQNDLEHEAKMDELYRIFGV